MSLQIWLPLNGNLKNKGCGDLTISSGTAQYLDTGKIGKCLNMGSRIMFRSTALSNITNENFSVAFWVRTDTSSTLTGNWVDILGIQDLNSNKSGTGTFRFEACYGSYLRACSWHDNDNYNTTNGSVTCVPDSEKGKWHHICVTMSGGKTKTYRDGTNIGEQTTVAGGYFNGVFYIGETNAIAGGINDVRIYDHALSVAEIKELAKGLCVHYKLDTPSSISNLVRNVSYNVYNNYASAGFTATLTNTGRTYNSCKIYRLTYTPGSDTSKLNNVKSSLANHGIYGFGRTFLANTKYCFWILCKPISHPDTVVGGTASNISGWTEIPMKKYSDDWFIVGQCRKGNVTENKTDSIYTSFKTPSAKAGVPITIDFCCPHLVEGSDSILPEYDYIGTNPGITDSSGYSNHGTKSGNISISDSTPRYSYSTKFDSGAHINVTLTTGGFGNTYTFSWWGKYSSYSSHMMWGFSNGNRLNLYMSGGNFYWNTGDGSSNPFNVSAATYGDNQWHHFAVTGDGTTAKLYIDGVFKANAKTYKGITGTTIYLNGWDSGTNYNFNGQLSDFRLYATALSADDIKRLYEVSASVSKNGSMLGYEMKEG